ncbi:small ribosomal subunit protein uS7m isoform X2 [Bacillus rossius redtenbacheri]
MYAPYFVEPVFKKEKQEQLKEDGELDKITHVPIRAALNDQTCSVFHDELVRKFTNYVMKSGQKALARELVEKAFENVKRIQLERYNTCPNPEDKEQIETNPLNVMYKAVANIKPLLQLSPIKRGGVTYQVPVPITEKRSNFIAMKWLIEAANDKERRVHFPEKLAWELLDAAKNQGRVVKKKLDLHRQCEANRAYAHYRWS